ncbi:hypothetical protein ACOMHN_046101 [Nucella lapillus]
MGQAFCLSAVAPSGTGLTGHLTVHLHPAARRPARCQMKGRREGGGGGCSLALNGRGPGDEEDRREEARREEATPCVPSPLAAVQSFLG